MSKDILFLTDKWCGMNPRNGLANHFDVLINTFRESPLDYLLHSLHFDESYAVYGTHINEILVPYCLNLNIKKCFITFNGVSDLNPSIEVLSRLKQNGIELYVIWYDNNPQDLALRDKVRDLVSLNVMLDYPKFNGESPEPKDKDLYLWTPQSKSFFYEMEKDIEVSFIGSNRYPDRQAHLKELVDKIPNLVVSGGQRESKLPFSIYSQLIRRSKMGINFCKNPMAEGYTQVKGRVFEITASKSLLFEESGSGTSDFFTPGEEYVEFTSVNDLINKINYYSSNSVERDAIALRGHNKFLEKYSPTHFWRKIVGS